MNTDSFAGRDIHALAVRDLWASVLLQAIDDLTGPEFLRAAAQRWFQSRSEEPRTFRWVCNHLNLSPATVLKRILPKQSHISDREQLPSETQQRELIIDDSDAHITLAKLGGQRLQP